MVLVHDSASAFFLFCFIRASAGGRTRQPLQARGNGHAQVSQRHGVRQALFEGPADGSILDVPHDFKEGGCIVEAFAMRRHCGALGAGQAMCGKKSRIGGN